jgi:hypothetical protein
MERIVPGVVLFMILEPEKPAFCEWRSQQDTSRVNSETRS